MAKKAAKTTAKKTAKKVGKKAATNKQGPSIGPIWKAIQRFEQDVRGMKTQTPAYASALKSLEAAKQLIPNCEGKTGEDEFRPKSPEKW